MWNGRLYAAYGDYSANTGPINVLSLDLADTAAGFTSEAALHTEETWFFRAVGDRLYVAYIDPQGYGDGSTGQVAFADAPGSWTVITNVTPVPIHVMGVCETAAGIFLFGAANEPDPPTGGATVWRSTDNGATWTVSLAPRPDPTNLDRFYTPMIYGDVIQIQRYDGAGRSRMHRWASGVWTEIADQVPNVITSDAVPFTYQGTPFHLCIAHGKAEGVVSSSTWNVRTQPADDAERATIAATIPAYAIRDACTDGTHLWLLDQDGTVWQGDITGTWEALFTLDLIPSSIAVDGDTAYFGTSDSSVYATGL